MPRGYRLFVIAFGLIATALAAGGVAWWLIYDATQLQQVYEQQARTNADKYADRAAIAEKRACVRLPDAEKFECEERQQQTARDGRRNEYDLQAQLVTSAWTRYMGIAAIIGMAVGMFGLALIYTTYAETRRTNELAKQHQRARLIVIPKVIPWPLLQGFDIALEAENVGSSIALSVSADAKVYTSPPEKPLQEIRGGYLYTIKSGDSQFLALMEDRAGFKIGDHICGTIIYHSIFGGPHRTFFSYEIIEAPPHPKLPNRLPWALNPSKPLAWPGDT